MARDFSIMLDNSAKERMTDTEGCNGRLGAVASAGNPKQFKIEFTGYVGNHSLQELQDSTGTISLNALLGDTVETGIISTVRKVSLQVGKAIGACCYAYLPEASVVIEPVDVDGLAGYKFTCIGSGALTGELAIG
jgi:hypothetical protein